VLCGVVVLLVVVSGVGDMLVLSGVLLGVLVLSVSGGLVSGAVVMLVLSVSGGGAVSSVKTYRLLAKALLNIILRHVKTATILRRMLVFFMFFIVRPPKIFIYAGLTGS